MFENGNKLSYDQFQEYLDTHHYGVNFMTDLLPQMKKLSLDCIKATKHILDPARLLNSFEVRGTANLIYCRFWG